MSSDTRNEITAPSDERDVRAATAEQQREFPYERDEEAQVTRREFCNFLGLTSCAFFVGAAGFAGKAALDAERTETFAPLIIEGAAGLEPGGSLNFHYPTEEDTAILVRTREGDYYPNGQTCPHLACPLYYERARERLECPCHEGSFELRTGDVIAGPPPRALDRIEIEVRGGEVWAVARRPPGDEHSI